ncbi:glycosyltransferase family 2 protein [Methanobacterium sp. ACI-7]|uniref:glycosyltransferase family 2 protein n=1 Tax=unclassified Methanobacterium TaxID=2627676 RepID=UPI0039C3B667
MIKTLAILPAYNEEIAIGSLILSTKKHVDEIIVVDDGSKDNTSEIAKLAGAKVIRHSSNKGKGSALKTGFRAVNGSDIVITMDSDGQHNPDEIPKLIEPIVNGEADIVNGSRYLNGHDKETPFYRRVGQMVLDKATYFNSGINVTDSQSGFRAFAKHTIPHFRFDSTDFSIESEMIRDVAYNGFKIKEVEIRVRYDVNGSTKNPLSHGIGVLMKVLLDMGAYRFNRK